MNTLSILILSVFLLSGCSNTANAGKDLQSELDSAYENLYLANFGLEYPPNQKILDLCIKNSDKSCLRVYRKVQDTKKFVLGAIDKDEDRVLNNTLNKIVVRCSGEKSRDDFTCVGAVISLYFFHNEKNQKKIQDALSKASRNSVKLVFSSRYEWMYNRPDSDKWVGFVKTFPDQVITPAERATIIKAFENSKTGFEKFGVML